MDTQTPSVKDLKSVLEEVERAVQAARAAQTGDPLGIKDFRRMFDQESSKINQAIFNDQPDQIRESTLRSVIPLLEILARS